MMICSCCGGNMSEGTTTFYVLKSDDCYVVRDAPALVCDTCDHAVFSQETTRKIERYCSGRLIPAKRHGKVWAFDWGEPEVHGASYGSVPNDTRDKDISLSINLKGTELVANVICLGVSSTYPGR